MLSEIVTISCAGSRSRPTSLAVFDRLEYSRAVALWILTAGQRFLCVAHSLSAQSHELSQDPTSRHHNRLEALQFSITVLHPGPETVANVWDGQNGAAREIIRMAQSRHRAYFVRARPVLDRYVAARRSRLPKDT